VRSVFHHRTVRCCGWIERLSGVAQLPAPKHLLLPSSSLFLLLSTPFPSLLVSSVYIPSYPIPRHPIPKALQGPTHHSGPQDLGVGLLLQLVREGLLGVQSEALALGREGYTCVCSRVWGGEKL
jgi:hypothetical protein